MADYKTVQYCRLCKKRYIILSGERKTYYCDDCQKRIERLNKKESKNKK